MTSTDWVWPHASLSTGLKIFIICVKDFKNRCFNLYNLLIGYTEYDAASKPWVITKKKVTFRPCAIFGTLAVLGRVETPVALVLRALPFPLDEIFLTSQADRRDTKHRACMSWANFRATMSCCIVGVQYRCAVMC